MQQSCYVDLHLLYEHASLISDLTPLTFNNNISRPLSIPNNTPFEYNDLASVSVTLLRCWDGETGSRPCSTGIWFTAMQLHSWSPGIRGRFR